MTTQQQIDAIIKDVWADCCWAESMEECNQIIAAGQKKVDALTAVQGSDPGMWPGQATTMLGQRPEGIKIKKPGASTPGYKK